MDEETAKRLVTFLSHERLKALIEVTVTRSCAIDLYQEILALGCEMIEDYNLESHRPAEKSAVGQDSFDTNGRMKVWRT